MLRLINAAATGSDAVVVACSFWTNKLLDHDGDYPRDFLESLSELPPAPNDVCQADDDL